MTRCYIDTNYLYVTLRATAGPEARELSEWRASVGALLSDGSAVVSALVVDELAYRLTLAWLADDGDPDPLSTYRSVPRETSKRMRRRLTRLWTSLDTLDLEPAVTDANVVDRAKTLIVDPGFTPRDAFHAAHAFVAACDVIVSADPSFDALRGIRRLGPRGR